MRIDRLLRVKGDDLDQERRISEAGLKTDPQPALAEVVAYSKTQTSAFLAAAESAGLTARKMLSSTDLVETVFRSGYAYRLDSALGNGTPFAARTVNQMYSTEEGAGAAYLSVTNEAFRPYLRSVWECAAYLGNEAADLRLALARSYKRLGFRDELWERLRST